MKKIMTMSMMMTIAISATAMTYNQARNEALFLSDKMAYELGLTKSQYEAVYEINLDYLMSVNRQASLFGKYWTRRTSSSSFDAISRVRAMIEMSCLSMDGTLMLSS